MTSRPSHLPHPPGALDPYRDPDPAPTREELERLALRTPTQELEAILADFGTRVQATLPMVLLPNPSQQLLKIHEATARAYARQLKSFCLNGLDIRRYEALQAATHKHHISFAIEEAIRCIDDYVRTYKFIQGLYLHLDELEAKREGAPIHILDAGCGPIPLYGLMAALKYPNVHATCLELNPTSAEMAADIIARHGLQDRVTIVNTDATTFVPGHEIDLLISETMHVGLIGSEYLPQILNHLAPYVAPDGAIIPEWVSVEYAFTEKEALLDHQKLLGTLPAVSVDVPHQTITHFDPRRPLDLIQGTISYEGLAPGTYYLSLGSEVGLHDRSGLKLARNESLLTAPNPIELSFDINGTSMEPTGFTFSYKPGSSSKDIQFQWLFSRMPHRP